MIEPFLSAAPIIQKLEEYGFEAYFVGGAVRDYLLNRTINDVDIATSATPDEMKMVFSDTVDIGTEHGTILVLYKGIGYEVTTFRTEGEYIDYRRPDKVNFVRSLNEDLQRRDFTMNAIAMNKEGKIIDPFNGYAAINNKMIESVGNPKERFHEDALRMIRAIRFVSQLNFTLNNKTKHAIIENAHLLQFIAVERLFAEFTKLINGINKKNAIKLLYDCGLWKHLPSIKKNHDLFPLCSELDIELLSENQVWLILIFLSKTNHPEAWLRAWRMPVKQIKYLTRALTALHNRFKEEWTVYSLYQTSKQVSIDVEMVFQTINKKSVIGITEKLENQFRSMPIQNREEINVSGTDLMTWFNRPGGPWIKQALDSIERAILRQEIINEKSAIKGWIQSCNHQQENDY